LLGHSRIDQKTKVWNPDAAYFWVSRSVGDPTAAIRRRDRGAACVGF
jgi:hypothetical protein